MGTSVQRYLTDEEKQVLAAQRQAMRDLANRSAGIAAGKFVFFAALDGTNNNKDDLGLSGSQVQTNVASLYDQAFELSRTNRNIVAKYYPGIGTGGEAGNILNAGILPTGPAAAISERAYAEFRKEALDYLVGPA